MSDSETEQFRQALERLNRGKFLRILAPLVHRGTYLAPGGGGPEGGFCYARGRESGAPMAPAVAAEEVRALLAQDLVENCPSGYRISAAGRAWLKRQLSAGDRFQAQHSVRSARVRETDGTKRLVVVNDAESPLAWLASRRDKSGKPLITPHQFAAGERLRADYTYAAMGPRVTASYNAASSATRQGGRSAVDAAHLSDTVLAARQRVARALAAVGPELASVLVDVCCHLKGLEEAEKQEGWPQRSGKVVLQIALTSLARHYGLISDAQPSRATSRMRHWGTSDYRPSIDAGGQSCDATKAG